MPQNFLLGASPHMPDGVEFSDILDTSDTLCIQSSWNRVIPALTGEVLAETEAQKSFLRKVNGFEPCTTGVELAWRKFLVLHQANQANLYFSQMTESQERLNEARERLRECAESMNWSRTTVSRLTADVSQLESSVHNFKSQASNSSKEVVALRERVKYFEFLVNHLFEIGQANLIPEQVKKDLLCVELESFVKELNTIKSTPDSQLGSAHFHLFAGWELTKLTMLHNFMIAQSVDPKFLQVVRNAMEVLNPRRWNPGNAMVVYSNTDGQ